MAHGLGTYTFCKYSFPHYLASKNMNFNLSLLEEFFSVFEMNMCAWHSLACEL